MSVIGWARLVDDPVKEAQLAADLVKRYRLDGFIANCEIEYEGLGFSKSKLFVAEFRRLLPNLPLGLSYIGYGYPYRSLDWKPWLDAGAAFLPQCYDNSAPGGKGRGHSVQQSLDAAVRAGIPFDRIMPTVATSDMAIYYSLAEAVDTSKAKGLRGVNVWTLESTPDDWLRLLTPLSV